MYLSILNFTILEHGDGTVSNIPVILQFSRKINEASLFQLELSHTTIFSLDVYMCTICDTLFFRETRQGVQGKEFLTHGVHIKV